MSGHTRLLAVGSIMASACFVALQPVGLATPAADAPFVGRILARERATQSTSVLISAEDLPTPTRTLSEITALLPSDRKLTPAHLPDGWKAEQRGRELRAWGQEVGGVRLRFDTNGYRLDDFAGRDATLRTGLNGQWSDPFSLKIEPLPRVSVTPDLDGILTVPPQASPGQPFLIGVAPGYRTGTWQLQSGKSTIPLVPVESIERVDVIKGLPGAVYGMRGTAGLAQILSTEEPRPFVTAFPETGRITGVAYVDEWGELVVEATITIGPAPPPTGVRSLTGGSAFAFAGQAACVSGTFPTFQAPYGLMLDGTTPLPVWGASQTTVMLGIPAGTTPGPHTITEQDGKSHITIGVLTVEGSLDQNKLWRGESTTMRLQVLGTEDRIPIAVLNRTPNIITITGGVRQVLTTPGGAQNAITRDVRGIMRGNFSIVYSVNSPGCGPGTGKQEARARIR